jgi:hypothetical protein
MARIAGGLGKLRAQVQARCPRAPKNEFGWIGDEAHQARTSDHNPDSRGIVHGLDIPHYPQFGLDCNVLAAAMLAARDKRTKYIIWNEKIAGDEAYAKRNGRKPWTKYNAADHTAHMHVSINTANEDEDHDWEIGNIGDDKPDEPVPPGSVRPLLKRGSTGPDVALVQGLLMSDGVYGPATAAAVKRFQEEQGNLTPDGMVGPATWRALEALMKSIEHDPPPIIPDPIIPPDPVDPVIPPPTTPEQRTRMAQAIVDFEARRDGAGRLVVYNLPPADGGGRYEVAGINEKYHKEKVDELVKLINAGKHEQAEREVVEYIAAYTDVATKWCANSAAESYLRDCVFNRGPTGAMRILQRAAKVKDDGSYGPVTKAAIDALTAVQLLARLRVARENYEREVVGRNESSQFWKGLVNRWDKALAVARTFLPPEGGSA